jgi:pimeloyl-ACP methyl ester carboxylesterase
MSRLLSLPLAVAAALALTAPASAAPTVTVKGVPAAGPAKYDKSYVTKFGPKSAKTVLVLMPGYAGGAGDFSLLGEDLTSRVKGLQVWAVDRRSQALEDTSMFDKGLEPATRLEAVRDYYLGWITNPQQPGPRFTPPSTDSLRFASEWGLPTAIGDLHRVILAARRQGKRVILGGHSLGASMTTIYATWDFGGRPGYRFIDGMVLIDGGTLGTFARVPTRASLDKRLAAVRKQPFADLVGLGLPWAQGVFAQLAGLYAMRAPLTTSPFWNDPLLPEVFRPKFPVTNRAMLGYAFDKTTSPESLALIHLRAGELEAAGDPRDWKGGEVSAIERVAQTFGSSPVNAVEWYFPQRLSIDVDAAHDLNSGRVARSLKLRTWHLRDVDVPLYAFQTDLTKGRVLRGARRFIERSRVRRSASALVDGSGETSHLDPLTASPSTSEFLDTVVPFLRRTMR